MKKLLPLIGAFLLSAAALVGCGGSSVKHTVAVTNKEELVAEWHVGDAGRTMTLSLKDDETEVNALAQLTQGNLKVESSNPAVLAANGFKLEALSAGEATVTVTYFEAKDTVAFNIQKELTAIDRYGTVHAGTLADPLDNADANKVGKWVEDHKAETGKDSTVEDLYIKGEVASFYHRPGERTSDAVVSYFLKAEGEDAQFEVYKTLNKEGKGLTDQDIWIGGTAVAHGKITFYGKQYETSAATLDSCEGGNKPGEQQKIDITVANAVKLMNKDALLGVDGSSTYDQYVFNGYIVYTDGSSYYVGDSKTSSIDNLKKLLQIYGPSDELKKLLGGDTGYQMKVKVTAQLKNYHSQLETICAYTVEKLEDGVKWPKIAEPAKLEGKTVAEFLADEQGNNKQLYVGLQVKVKGYYDKNTDFTKYGNLVVTDLEDGNEFTIYGATASSSALAWNEIGGKYIFTNPQNFLTQELTKGIKIGDVLKVNLVRSDYTKKTDEGDVVSKQGCGIVTKVGLDLPDDLVVSKTNSGIGTTTLTEAKQVEYEVKAGKIKLEWSAGCFDYSSASIDEFGIGKTSGYVKLVSLPEGKKVAKIVIDLYQYNNIKVFASADGTGDEVTGTEGTASGKDKGKMMEYAINGAAFYISNTSNYNQGVYSMTVVLADAA